MIKEEPYHLLGFENGNDLQIENNTWFTKLNPQQLNLLSNCLTEKSYF